LPKKKTLLDTIGEESKQWVSYTLPKMAHSLVHWNLLSFVDKKINEKFTSLIIETRPSNKKWEFGGCPH